LIDPGDLPRCKRDALPAELTTLNQNYRLVITIIYESQNRY